MRHYDYDPRTWKQKYHDDNTWTKTTPWTDFYGNPYKQWCPNCTKVINVILVQTSNVFDRDEYFACPDCGTRGGQLREPTNEELNQ